MIRTSKVSEYLRSNSFILCCIVVIMVATSCQGDQKSTAPATSSRAITETVTKSATTAADTKPSSVEVKTQAVKETSTSKIVETKVITPEPPKKKSVKKPAAEPKKKATVVKPKPAPAPKPVVEPKAIISFDRMSHSFGEIKSGDIIEHKFYFTNTGNTDLIVDKATATCGCTQPSFPFIPVAPGEKGFIGVTYNSVGKDGPQRPKVTVYTNAEPGIYNIYLQGEVLPKEEKVVEENVAKKE